jgi:carboxymethylenebutenolidase
MCHADDSNPPPLPPDLVRAAALPRLAGGAGAEITEATAQDGTRFSIALALSSQPRDPAVVIVPDVRGLYRFYTELAERFAAAGHHAVAIDPFGRTAGAGGERPNDWDYWQHALDSDPQAVQHDIAAAIEVLRERGDAERFAVVGFCYGGSQAFLSATNPDLDLDRVVGFYGGLNGEKLQMPAARDEIARARVPVLGLFGGADEGIPEAERAKFAENLERAGVAHEIHVYPGAPHSFFDRKQEEFADASADAWRRTLAFLAD